MENLTRNYEQMGERKWNRHNGGVVSKSHEGFGRRSFQSNNHSIGMQFSRYFYTMRVLLILTLKFAKTLDKAENYSGYIWKYKMYFFVRCFTLYYFILQLPQSLTKTIIFNVSIRWAISSLLLLWLLGVFLSWYS